MDNLWFLSEERPKPSVILQITEMYCKDFDDSITTQEDIKIKPIIEDYVFTFTYEVEGLKVKNADKLYIKTASGFSSFLDFLLFKQEQEPIENSTNNNLLMGIEETKTSDDESRNTGVYQRGTKFIYINYFYQDLNLYMLYNEELEAKANKKPSDTSIFGTNLLLTLNVNILGKDTSRWFKPFNSIDELIDFKSNMRKPPKGNTPIEITKYEDYIEISGRLAKPGKKSKAYKGNISHDPNIGALSLISACLRKLGWDKDIVITQHEVSQSYVNKHNDNKFLYICHILNIKLDGLDLPNSIKLPSKYWHYERKSEKIASILLHIVGLYSGMYGIYENHAGCERGYFKDKSGELIALPKKDKQGKVLYIPDVVLYDEKDILIVLVEGKKLKTLNNGIKEIQQYNSLEAEYIKPNFPEASIYRCVSIFGGMEHNHLHEDVLIYVNELGEIYLNPNTPACIVNAFKNVNQ